MPDRMGSFCVVCGSPSLAGDRSGHRSHSSKIRMCSSMQRPGVSIYPECEGFSILSHFEQLCAERHVRRCVHTGIGHCLLIDPHGWYNKSGFAMYYHMKLLLIFRKYRERYFLHNKKLSKLITKISLAEYCFLNFVTNALFHYSQFPADCQQFRAFRQRQHFF